jgi:hypothetical protein
MPVSVPFLNTNTTAAMFAANSDAKQVQWELRAILPHDYTCPFYDNFIGGQGADKAFTEIANLNLNGGTALKIPVYADIGTPGFVGSAQAMGNEAVIKSNFYTAQVGINRQVVGISSAAKEETVIGSQSDRIASEVLYRWVQRRKSYDLMYALITTAEAQPSRLKTFPSGVISREGLRSANIAGWDDFMNVGNQMRTNGAKPMSIGTHTSSAKFRKYMFFGAHTGFAALRSSSKWTTHTDHAAAKSNTDNPAFSGQWLDLDGHGIYPWELEDHDADGPIGAPIVPRAALGAAITAGTATFNILGGGNATSGALTAPLYFQWFSNAQYVACDGTTTVADTSTQRYALIQDGTTGLFGFFGFIVNDGNKLTVNKRLGPNNYGIRNQVVGNVTWNTGVWANLHTEALSEGSIIYETNSYGQPFNRIFGLGANALVCGHANIESKVGIAQRIVQTIDYGEQQGIGIRFRWGCAPVKNTNNQARNFIVLEAAYNPPGLPVIV